MNSENQKTASKTMSKTTNNIDTAIHNIMDNNSPAIPSPTSTEGMLNVGVVLPVKSPVWKFRNFGKLSISPIPM